MAIAKFAGSSQFEEPFAARMAASMVTVRLIVLVLILQRTVLASLTSGAVKG